MVRRFIMFCSRCQRRTFNLAEHCKAVSRSERVVNLIGVCSDQVVKVGAGGLCSGVLLSSSEFKMCCVGLTQDEEAQWRGRVWRHAALLEGCRGVMDGVGGLRTRSSSEGEEVAEREMWQGVEECCKVRKGGAKEANSSCSHVAEEIGIAVGIVDVIKPDGSSAEQVFFRELL